MGGGRAGLEAAKAEASFLVPVPHIAMIRGNFLDVLETASLRDRPVCASRACDSDVIGKIFIIVNAKRFVFEKINTHAGDIDLRACDGRACTRACASQAYVRTRSNSNIGCNSSTFPPPDSPAPRLRGCPRLSVSLFRDFPLLLRSHARYYGGRRYHP